MSYEWLPEITVKLESVHTEIKSSNMKIRITPKTNAQRSAEISGGVRFGWKSSPVIPNEYFAVVKDMEWVPIEIVKKIDTELYESTGSLIGSLGANLKVATISVEQPAITITPNLQLTSIEAGKGVGVIIDCTADYVPGKVTVDFMDITIPTPAGNVTIPIPPVELLIGQPATSRMMTQYDLICTDYNEMPEYLKQDHGYLLPFDQYEDLPIGRPGETDVRAIQKLFRTSGDTNVLSWKLTVDEGHAAWYMHIAKGKNGTTPVKAKPEDWGLPRRRKVTHP